MFRLPINIFIFANFILLYAIITACSFIDLRSIKYSIEPHAFGSILTNSDTPLVIRFDTEMNKNDAEGIFQISSDSGSVQGDCFWEENNYCFVPVAGWTPGIRYSLNINGNIRSMDGRELRLQYYTVFYAVNKNPPPVLEKHSPAEGEAIGTADFIFELYFSDSMNKFSVESALTIDGTANKTYEWFNNDKILKVIAEKPLSAWTQYRWTLKETAKNIDGVPLPKQYSGSFITNTDQKLPSVVNVYPAVYSNGNWSATGASIETGLSLGESIAIEFSKPMDASVLRSIHFEPSISGRAEMLTDNKAVYIFTRNPEPETPYTLIVSADAKDTTGLKIGSDYRVSFLPDIPYLNILAINDSSTVTETGEITFTIVFSLPFDNEDKQNAALKINLSPFFPRTLPPIALQYVHWISDDRVYMRWVGLEAGIIGEEHYYKLSIPGGKGGVTAKGLYMNNNAEIILEAVNEK